MLHVLFPQEGESWIAFIERIAQQKKELVVIISGQHDTDLLHNEKQCQVCLQTIAQRSKKTYLATHNQTLIRLAKARGVECISSSRQLKEQLKGHPQYQESIREFLPQVWRQHLRSKLQSMGLLSLPKVRIWILLGVCGLAFMYTVLKLLPSAEVTIRPRQETVVQTSNIFLVQSGSSLQDIPSRVRSIGLIPIRATLTKTITFDGVSKEFLGTNSKVSMSIVNESEERFSLREGSRVANNAGIVFKILRPINIDPGETIITPAESAETDLYNAIIGERGNVPANLRWDFIGLNDSDQRVVYATNITEGIGGETSHRLVYSKDDMPVANAFLQQKLLSAANQQIDEQIEQNNLQNGKLLTRLFYDELRTVEFSNFDIAERFIGQPVSSVPVTGTVVYTAYAYNKQYVLDILEADIRKHAGEHKEILIDSISPNALTTHVMEYNDNLDWIKITVDLAAVERTILDPLTPSGMQFGNKVRSAITGRSLDDAKRIVSNMPEVDRAQVSLWPPWARTMPDISYNISIRAEK